MPYDQFVREQLAGVLAVRLEDGGMSDLGAIHQVVAALQGVGVGELVRQAASGMGQDAVGQIDQGARPALVTQTRGPEMRLAPCHRFVPEVCHQLLLACTVYRRLLLLVVQKFKLNLTLQGRVCEAR